MQITPSNRTGRHNLTCFLVEDNPLLRDTLTATLEEALPLRVVGSAEGESDALRWIDTTGVACDLMVIDLVLKSGSGLEVLRQASAAGSLTKLVVLSNHVSDAVRQRCMMLGADRVFDKATELDDLFAWCEQVAAKKRH
ncbi:MAG: response regulator transcription factor [Chitinophagaceae bacterium]|nr:response regulator transcription factor [Rubrivivax sp.]